MKTLGTQNNIGSIKQHPCPVDLDSNIWLMHILKQEKFQIDETNYKSAVYRNIFLFISIP